MDFHAIGIIKTILFTFWIIHYPTSSVLPETSQSFSLCYAMSSYFFRFCVPDAGYGVTNGRWSKYAGICQIPSGLDTQIAHYLRQWPKNNKLKVKCFRYTMYNLWNFIVFLGKIVRCQTLDSTVKIKKSDHLERKFFIWKIVLEKV